MSVHFSSASDEWATPLSLFNKLHAEFTFGLDAAATDENAKCALYFTAEEDALKGSWGGHGAVWVNPPYSRGLQAKFIQKALEESKEQIVVMLIPARPDTKAWHQWIFPNAEVRFIKGRVKFGDAKASAPFPSAIIIFRPTRNPNCHGATFDQ